MKGLARKREVLAIARKLDKDRRIVACLCMEMWEWSDSESADGHIQGATKADIDGMLGSPGFGDAVEAEGWLKVCDGGLTIPKWDRHNGESAKARLLASERSSRFRNAKRNGSIVTPSSLLSGSDPPPDSEGDARGNPTRQIRLMSAEVRPLWESYPPSKRGGLGGFQKALQEALGTIETLSTAEALAWLHGRVRAYAKSDVGRGEFALHAKRFFDEGVFSQPDTDWMNAGKAGARVETADERGRREQAAADREARMEHERQETQRKILAASKRA